MFGPYIGQMAPAPVYGTPVAPVVTPAGFRPQVAPAPVTPAGRLVNVDAVPNLRRFAGEVAYGGQPVPGGGWTATLYLPLPPTDGSGSSSWSLELTAYIPGGWERELREASQRAQAKAAVSGPSDGSMVWCPCGAAYFPLPIAPEVGFLEALLPLLGGIGTSLPVVGPILSALGLGGAGAGAAGAGAGAAGAGAGAGAAGAAGGVQNLLTSLLPLLGGVLGGQTGGANAAGPLAGADVLSQALLSLAPQLFGNMVGPLAELLRGSMRATDAQLRASTGDPAAREWISASIRSAEGRIADSLRLANTLIGLTTPPAL